MTALHEAAEGLDRDLRDLIKQASAHINFLKHADRDPDGVLDGLSQNQVDNVLFIACNDFGRIAKGQPIEMQVYEAWFLARFYAKVSNAPARHQQLIRNCISFFNDKKPGFRTADRAVQIAAGLAALDRARDDPRFVMEIHREVILPPAK